MIECTICPVMWERTKNYFLDMKKIFTPLFIKNRYHLHLGLSFLLTIPTILFMMNYMHLADTGLFFQSFLGGCYGGWLGALVGVYIYTLL